MLTSFTTRCRNVIWFLIFTFTLYCMPHPELLLPYKLHLFITQAEASETQPETPPPNQTQEQAPLEDPALAPPRG